jgi:hypothetical protein
MSKQPTKRRSLVQLVVLLLRRSNKEGKIFNFGLVLSPSRVALHLFFIKKIIFSGIWKRRGAREILGGRAEEEGVRAGGRANLT